MKMNGIRNLLTICALLAAVVTTAQEKIVERSAKRAPEWIGSVQPGALIVSAEGEDLESAKRACIEEIKRQVIEAVAVNITAVEESTTRQLQEDGNFRVSSEYASQLRTVAAKMPFVTGITLANASECYWERRYVKKEKRYYWLCHVKYPFTRMEQSRLTAEFQANDRAQYDKYLALKEYYSTFTQIEEIGRCITELDPLIAYFFDERRRDEAAALQRSYRALYGHIAIVEVENTPGEYRYALTLDGREVTCGRLPRVKSEFAANAAVAPCEGGRYRVTYDYEGCLPEDANTVDLLYAFGGRTVKHTFRFDVGQEQLGVLPQGRVSIEVQPEAALRVGVNLRSRYDAPFTVEQLSFTAAGIGGRIESGAVNRRFEGRGTHRLVFTVAMPGGTDSARAALTDGYLVVRNAATGRSETVRFALPYTISE